MTKWEYATVPLISHATQQILNQWGADGWELVTVMESRATSGAQQADVTSLLAYFKRPVTE